MNINLFHIPTYTLNTEDFSHTLHGEVVTQFEETFCKYVGASYGCSINSATNAIFLALHNMNARISIPSMIPPVVANAILTSGNYLSFKDDVEWVGNSYVLHHFKNYKIIDSAQKVEKDQFKKEANDEDLMIFSFYPTKPVGSCDGGIIVSNDREKIEWFKRATLNGMGYARDNWERQIFFPGWKMYMNSFQATIALNNLYVLPEKYERLRDVRQKYNEAFNLTNESNHLYRICVKDNVSFISKMKKEGITCGVHYDALHLHPVYDVGDECPKSEKSAKTTVSLPFHEKLTQREVDKVITATLKNEH